MIGVRAVVLAGLVALLPLADAAAWTERRETPYGGWGLQAVPRSTWPNNTWNQPPRHRPHGELLYDRYGRPRAYVTPRQNEWNNPWLRYDRPWTYTPPRPEPRLDWR